MSNSHQQQVQSKAPTAKNAAPKQQGERKVPARQNNARFDKAAEDLQAITSKLGAQKPNRQNKSQKNQHKSAAPASQRRENAETNRVQKPNAGTKQIGQRKTAQAKTPPQKTIQKSNPSRKQQSFSGINASDLAEKSLLLDESLQQHSDILHDIKIAKSNVHLAIERAQAAYALTESIALESDAIVRSFLIESINATLKHVSGYLELRKIKKLNFLTGQGFDDSILKTLQPIDFSTHINLMGEGMAPQVLLKSIDWIKPQKRQTAAKKPIAQFTTSAIESAIDLRISHDLPIDIHEESGVIYTDVITPSEVDGLFTHYDTSQANGLSITKDINIVDLSPLGNHGGIRHRKNKEGQIALSVCPINQQRGLCGLNGSTYAIHLEPNAQNRWPDMSDMALVMGIATTKLFKSRQSILSFGTQEAGLHLYTENGKLIALIWSEKGRQKIALAGSLKPNCYQTIAIKFSAEDAKSCHLSINNKAGKIIHQQGQISALQYEIEGASKRLGAKLPILHSNGKISLEEFGANNQFDGIFTELVLSQANLNLSHIELLSNYMTLKWASVCLSLSVIDQRSQLESIGKAVICLTPAKQSKSVIASQRVDNPDIVADILNKLKRTAQHLDKQEKSFSQNPECIEHLSKFAGKRDYQSHGLETPEQFAELLASSIKINLSHKNLNLLERNQRAALSLVQNGSTTKKSSHIHPKSLDGLADLADRDLLPSMDEICDSVGF